MALLKLIGISQVNISQLFYNQVLLLQKGEIPGHHHQKF